MDDDSDTANSFVNNVETVDDSFNGILVNTPESKSAFKRLIICSVFAFLTVVTVFVPGLNVLVDTSLKALFTVCSIAAAYKVYLKAIKDIFKKKITADVVLGVCTFVSFVFAIFTGFHLFKDAILINSDFYFVVTVINLWAMMLGAYLKTRLKNRSADALAKLDGFLPEKVRILAEGHEEIVDLKSVRSGSYAKVLPGETIPFDGIVVEGETSVDESALTGKDIPVDKVKDDIVYAGGINKYGEITVKSLYNGRESLVFRLIQSAKRELENGPEQKSITERTSEKYLILITLLSAVIGAVFAWLHFAPVDALLFAVMTFILACPMTFAFAEPLLLASVVSKANKENVLFRNPEVVTFLNDSGVFVFDKEAVLSTGDYTITDFQILGDFHENEVLEYASGIESVTEHLMSDAIFDYIFSKGIPQVIPDEVTKLDNGAVKAVMSGKEIVFGDRLSFDDKFFEKYLNMCEKLEKEGKIIAFLSVDSVPAAIIAAKDSYKPGALEFINYLDSKGIEIQSFASNYISDDEKESFPDARVGKIKALKSKGKTVVMIGDGVNDALSFVSADIAISVGNENLARFDTADVVIPSNDFSDIVKALNIGNAYKNIAKQNIVSAIAVNIILLIGAFASVFSGYSYIGPEVLVAALISIFTVFVNTRRIMKDK